MPVGSLEETDTVCMSCVSQTTGTASIASRATRASQLFVDSSGDTGTFITGFQSALPGRPVLSVLPWRPVLCAHHLTFLTPASQNVTGEVIHVQPVALKGVLLREIGHRSTLCAQETIEPRALITRPDFRCFFAGVMTPSFTPTEPDD